MKQSASESLPDSGGDGEEIAIVGIGCRFPGGASSPSRLWSLLLEGRDAIIDIPEDRWDRRRFFDPAPDNPMRTRMRRGGFLTEPWESFDAPFFGLSPREASQLDPQQRLLLEVSWEALEDAGIPPDSLAGSDTGVYTGGFTFDNAVLRMSPLNLPLTDIHSATSSTLCMLSNRVSHLLDLRGPSLTIDTACSSSLVAFHYACRDLLDGTCGVALAGGVNFMLIPEFPISMSNGHFLSPGGTCKMFDAGADGYGRGEGTGVVILKPLSKALADGDRVYAVVRGTGINQDGKTPGISLPNADSQESLLRAVHERAGLDPAQISFIEAHGTGTQAGDLAEATALGRILARDGSRADPVPVGSIKTNIGHLEAAAGIAGVIKAALVLHHREIPPNLHFETPNPEIPLSDLRLRVPVRREPLSPAGSVATACVNSFGYGGTNAHAVLSELPPDERPGDLPPGAEGKDIGCPLLFPVSARSEESLLARAADLARFLSEDGAGADIPLQDLGHTLAHRQAHLEQRLAVLADSRNELVSTLRSASRGEFGRRAIRGRARFGKSAKTVFVFTGMGPQWEGMGRELLREDKTFRETAERCDGIFSSLAGRSLLDEMAGDGESGRMAEPNVSQPANLLLQASLLETWRSLGVEPGAVVGHSVGELAAALAAGALSLEDAFLVCHHRSRLQQRLLGRGGMLATGLSPREARGLLEGLEDLVSIASFNSHSSVTLSGDPVTLEEIAAHLERKGVFQRMLHVGIAYHSPQMDEMEDEFRQSIASIWPRANAVPLYSTVTGSPIPGDQLDAGYWWRNARDPVRFESAANELVDDGFANFLEIGPHPVLRSYLVEALLERSVEGAVASSLRRGESECDTMREARAELWCAGTGISTPASGRFFALPPYPWNRLPYFHESPSSRDRRLGPEGSPLPGSPVPGPGRRWRIEITGGYFPWLSDHRVSGVTAFPGAAFVETMLAASVERGGKDPRILESIEFLHPLVLEGERGMVLQTELDPESNRVAVHAGPEREDSREGWEEHARARILTAPIRLSPAALDLDAIRSRCPENLGKDTVYEILARQGLAYGAKFRGIREIRRGDGEWLAEIEIPETSGRRNEFHLHPVLLDAAFQTLVAGAPRQDREADRVFVPVEIERLRFFAKPGSACRCYGRITFEGESSIRGDLTLCDDSGEPLFSVEGLRCQAVPRGFGQAGELAPRQYVSRWESAKPVRLPSPACLDGDWVVAGGRRDERSRWEELLSGLGATIVPSVDSPGDSGGHGARPGSETSLAGAVFLGSAAVDDIASESACVSLLRLVQSIGADGAPDRPFRLAIVTEGATPVIPGESPVKVHDASLCGLARVIANERSQWIVTLLDVDGTTPEEDRAAVLAALTSTQSGEEAAFREGVPHRRILSPLDPADLEREPELADTPEAFALDPGNRGNLQGLHFREAERRAPGPGEVEIAIRVAGLNFKDIAKSLGILSDRILEGTWSGDAIGFECAGEITRTGPDIDTFRPGDAVIAMFRGGVFRSHATISLDDSIVAPIPPGLDPEEACFLVPAMTVAHALGRIARLRKGESILIHSATGGVGLAAIQFARRVGATIFATAGSEEKRDYLRSIGIEHAMDSRSLDFAEQIRSATGGRGVDVVLNSLSGEALEKGFELLAPYGRFLELGKRDIDENRGLPMRAFNRNLSFTAIDLDRLIEEEKEMAREIVEECLADLESGRLRPLPVDFFPASRIGEAFQHLARARHIGKVVVDMRDPDVPVLTAPPDPATALSNGTFLVTGGTNGFGWEAAKWLARRGASTIVLASRTGEIAETEELDRIEKSGTRILVERVDVGDREALERVFESLSSLPPLRGVIHAAGAISDSPLDRLEPGDFAKAFRGKARGAWFLHELTEPLDLDFFVLFSSVSSLVGNPGQGNYAAANAFLDGLASWRRSRGLPALSVNWGALSEVGMLAREPQVSEHLERVGIGGMTPEECLGLLEPVLDTELGQVMIADVDWKKWGAAFPVIGATSPFARLVSTESENARLRRLRADMESTPPARRLDAARDRICEIFSRVLGMPGGSLDPDLPFAQAGIDSLLALELQATLSSQLGVSLSSADFSPESTANELARTLLRSTGVDPLAETGGGLAEDDAGSGKPVQTVIAKSSPS